MTPQPRQPRRDDAAKYVDARQIGPMVGLSSEQVAKIAIRHGLTWHRHRNSFTLNLDQILAAVEKERASAEEAA